MSRDDDLFADALELPAAERAGFLEHACAGDPALRARVEALLASHDAARSYLETPLGGRPPVFPEERASDTIGPYRLVRRLGEGGCGVVWLAEQLQPLRRQVALKVIKLGMDTRSVITRFQAERQALALMTHPDIAQVYDAGTTAAGRPYFVMEYVEGTPVTRFCDEHNLPMPTRLELFARICLAVQHAHQKGVVHRDLKPSNILVAWRDGMPAPKIIDFGIAKATAGRLTEETLLTEFGLFLGTPAYMSPEQAEQRETDLDTRSDIYSLGVLLYELLTGRPPYDPKELARAGVLEVRRIIREVDPPRPSTALTTLAEADLATVARQRGAAPPRLTAALRGDLDWIVMRCLEKDRERRYSTAAALAEDVRRHLRQEPVEARPPSATYRLRKFAARNRLAVASATVSAATLATAAVVSTVQAVRATRAESIAATERDAANNAQRAEALARADAQRRQEQAEDLLTFMLGDFRTELQKIGRLNLLDRVGEKAMAYFTALDPRDLTDAALTRQAKALTQIGEVRLEQARYAEAETAFATAHARAAALAARHPQNADMLFERAQAEFWIGFTARRRGDFVRQREWLVRYRDTGLELAAVEGPTPRALREVASGHHNLAVLEVEADNLAAAQAGFQAERAVLEPLWTATPDKPDLLAKRADISSWLGTVAETDGRYADAAACFADMGRHYESLRQLDPKAARWAFSRAQSFTFSGLIALITGRRAEATALLGEARTLLESLVAQDPANKRWLGTLLTLRLFQLEAALADPASANLAPALQETRTQLEALATGEPTSLTFARQLSKAWRLEARLHLAGKRLAAAAEAVAQAARIAEPFRTTAAADSSVRHEAAHVAILAWRVARANGQPADADKLWHDASAALGSIRPDTHDWRLLEPAALAATLTGRANTAQPLIERLKTFGYRPIDPDYAAILGLSVQPPIRAP